MSAPTPQTPDDSLAARLDAVASAPDVRLAVGAVLRAHHEAARERIAARLATGGVGGIEVARLYSAAADDLLVALWRFTTGTLFPSPNPTEAEKLALIAVGGYGRGVLAPFSDLDLLFLRPWKTTARTETVAEFILYVLWDLGLKVGSAARSVDECLSLARTDMVVRTTLLEARVLAGDEPMARDFLRRFRSMVANADPKAFIAAKMEERDARHSKAGAVRYRVEPNIKDGKGGLRDLNTLFWIARALAPDSDPGIGSSPIPVVPGDGRDQGRDRGAAVLDDLLTPKERRTFEDAFDFLWRVRAHLHLTAGRAEEKLTFDLQPEVARRMGWRGRGDEPAVERFMRRYFLVARDVGALTRAMSATLEGRHQKKTQSLTRQSLGRMGLSRLMPGRKRDLGTAGFFEDSGRLSVTGTRVFEEDPVKLLTLFVTADRFDLDLHPDAFSAVMRSLALVTTRLRRDPRATAALLHILAHGQRPYRVLTIMNETGLLGRFLPEWGRIVGQTQFNMYHAYTVDEHSLQAIGIINDIFRGKLKTDHPLSSEIIHLIADPEVLMLAMLLHDVGKGGERGQLEDGAIAARRACERLGVESRRIELVVWLVRNHLALSDYAQKRDTSDPATARAFAELVGDPERLRLLLVLTVADIRAVGPGVWNSWKGQLITALYTRVEALFRGEGVEAIDPLQEHADLIARACEGGAAAEARTGPGRIESTTEIVLAARDRPGLFADLTAVLAAAGADVTGARVATAPDGTVLDVFQVQDGADAPYGQTEPRRLTSLVTALEAAARTETIVPPPAMPAPTARRAVFDVRPVVMIDTAASETATVIEVSGADRPGLLAELSRTLSDHDLSIRSAHVAAFGERAVDSFYVTDRRGRKIFSEQLLNEVQTALEAVLERAPAAPAGRRITAARASARDVSDLGRLARRSPAATAAPAPAVAKPVSPEPEAR